MLNFDRAAIAARVRELLGDNIQNLADTATRLKVGEISLRMSIDEMSPHPTIDVLAAIVRHYRVDPSWLLLGDPAATTHLTDKTAAVTALQDFVDSRMAISAEMI